METPANADIVKITEKLTRQPAQAVAYGTEAPYLQALGMETIILGPGDIDQAHQPDEFVSLDSLEPTSKMITMIAEQFLNELF